MVTVIDADKHILGRLSTNIAKRILNGEEVIVVNAEKAIITGDRQVIFNKYLEKYHRGKQNTGPFFPKRADLILKKTVRGMIPYMHPRGREAYRRVRVYVGIPKELESAKIEKIESAMTLWTDKYVTLGEVAERLGSRVR